MAAAPAPGTGGTGKDADGGKERAQFEGDRRDANSNSPDRPPVYKPVDDGVRNYHNTPGGFVTPGANTPAHVTIKMPMKGVKNPHNIHK